MARIFLSYVREDEEKVEHLYQKLSDAGFKPWMVKKDILPGELWDSSIQKAIQRSDFFLACLSANSVNKKGFFQREIKYALDILQERLEDDIYLIPVRLEDCEVPEVLRRFQWIDLFEDDGWKHLLKAIQEGLKRSRAAVGIQYIDERLEVHRRSLRRLEVQAANYGMDIPLELNNRIEATKREIRGLETRLNELATQKVKHKVLDLEGDEAQHLNLLLRMHRRNLNRLEEQAQHYGLEEIPLRLLNGIEWEKQEIVRLEAELRRLAPRVPMRKVTAVFSSEQWSFALWVVSGLAGLAVIIVSRPLWLKLVGVLPIIGVGVDFLRWRLEGYLRGIILSQVTAVRMVRDTRSALSELQRSLKNVVPISSDTMQGVEEDTEQKPEATPSADRRKETFAVAKLAMPRPGELPRVDEEFTLLTGILQRIPAGFIGEPIELPGVATVELDVTVHAQDMTILPHWNQKLRYYAGRDSGLLEFRLCPNAAGWKEIRVEFHYQLHWLAQIKFEIEVAEQEELALLTEPMG